MQKIDALHAAGHTKRCGDSCEDGDDEVDDHLPGLLLCLCTHDKSVLIAPPFIPPPFRGGRDMLQGGQGRVVLIIWIKKWFACLGN